MGRGDKGVREKGRQPNILEIFFKKRMKTKKIELQWGWGTHPWHLPAPMHNSKLIMPTRILVPPRVSIPAMENSESPSPWHFSVADPVFPIGDGNP